jgi:hypothetical protein
MRSAAREMGTNFVGSFSQGYQDAFSMKPIAKKEKRPCRNRSQFVQNADEIGAVERYRSSRLSRVLPSLRL